MPELDFEYPVTQPFTGERWITPFVPHYGELMTLVEPARKDALVERDWQTACTALDRKPEPTTIEEANERLWGFTQAVRGIVERFETRMAKRMKLRRK